MPLQIPINFIIDKVLHGIAQAQKDYSQWSDNEWLWNAPEYMLSTYVAQKIWGLDGAKYITLENNVKSAVEDAGIMPTGKLHPDLRASGRFDIMLWWGDGSPRAPIEIKNQVDNFKVIRNDLLRIKKVLELRSGTSSFQFGVIAFYTSVSVKNESIASSQNRITEILNRIFDCANEFVGPKLHLKPFKNVYVEGDSAWAVVALLIK